MNLPIFRFAKLSLVAATFLLLGAGCQNIKNYSIRSYQGYIPMPAIPTETTDQRFQTTDAINEAYPE